MNRIAGRPGNDATANDATTAGRGRGRAGEERGTGRAGEDVGEGA